MGRGRKPIVQCTPHEWRELCNQLRACCPPPEGYDWRFVWCGELSGGDDLGGCSRTEPRGVRRGTYRIKVIRGLSRIETLDTLIHEMAHAYDTTWGPHHGWGGNHSDTFWIWVGRIYRRWYGECGS